VLKRVDEEIAKDRSDLPDALKLKQAELDAEQRRLANFVDFIGEGRGSQALAKALVETECRVDRLADEVDSLRRSRERVFRAPPVEWDHGPAQPPCRRSWSSAPRARHKRSATSPGPSDSSSSPPTSAAPSTAPSRPSTRSPL
jgi:hypothetical protein